jgi:4-aminobutyrate aminotransferase
MGERFIAGLNTLYDRFPRIGDVRGKGLMIGVEMVQDRKRYAPDAALAGRIIQRCFEKGMLILTCGKSTIRFMPPLVISVEEVDLALRLFEEALDELTAS